MLTKKSYLWLIINQKAVAIADAAIWKKKNNHNQIYTTTMPKVACICIFEHNGQTKSQVPKYLFHE